jgi:hypothetical protein
MRKINYLVIGLFITVLSCGKDNTQPTTPIVTTTTSSGSTSTGSTSTTTTTGSTSTTKKDCEINHQGSLKVVNTSSKDFYIYIEDIYVVTSKAGTISTYTKVPAHSGLEIKALQITDNSDLRSVTMPFYDCMVTEIEIN